MKKQCYVFIKCLMVLCITVIATYTSQAPAQMGDATTRVDVFADRDIILEGTAATIAIESSLTVSVAITPSISGLSMGSKTTVKFSVTSIDLTPTASSALFTLSVPDNDEPQAHETLIVEFTAEPDIPDLPSLTFTIPPNDLIASVSPPARLSINNTMNTAMIAIQPRLQSNKSFIFSSTNNRLIVTTGIITPSRSPFPIEVALNPNTLLGEAERLNLTINHIDTWQTFTEPTAQNQINAGEQHSCAIRTNNTVACWGRNDFGQRELSSSPDPNVHANTKFLAVSAGLQHACGIKADGTVVCWGRRANNRTNLTSNPQLDVNTKFLAVSAGDLHSCGIKANGRVACWGDNGSEQSSPTSSPDVDANTRFMAVIAGREHSCGIKADERVACWGDDSLSQRSPTSNPDVDANTRFLTVSAGDNHNCGIKADGQVACWGNGGDGQTNPTSNPYVNTTTTFVAVSAGNTHTCGITADRWVACWGSDASNQSSPTSSLDVDTTTTAFVAVSAGGSHTCGIKANRRVACWGRRDEGQSSPTSVGFQQANTTADVVHLAERSTVITNAVEIVEARGIVEALHPRLSLTEGRTLVLTLFRAIQGPSKPIAIVPIVTEANKLNINPRRIVLTENNRERQIAITAVNNNVFANIDPATIVLRAEPRNQVQITPFEAITVNIANNDVYQLRFTQERVMLSEGENTKVSLSINPPPPPSNTVAVTFIHPEEQLNINPPQVLFSPTNIQRDIVITVVDDLLPEDTTRFTVSIAPPAGIAATVANTLSVEVSADTDLPLINAYTASTIVPEGTTATVVINAALRQAVQLQLHTTPTAMSTATDVELSIETVSLSAGIASASFDIVVTDNDEPQASNNSFNLILTAPSLDTQTLTFTVPPNDLTASVTQVATFKVADTNPSMTMAITPPLQDNKSFVVASTDSRFIITAGIITQAHSLLPIDLALSEDTHLSQQEQLNVIVYHIDARAPFNTPTAQAQISAADRHSCAIKANNTVACWGLDNHNQSSPTSNDNINDNTRFVAISAGGEHSCGLSIDGTALCWGQNNHNQSISTTAMGVDDNTRFIAISAGNEHSCGIKADSTAVCWGTNDDRSHPSSHPDVDDDTRFVAISAGGEHSCGLSIDGTALCWGQNNYNQSISTTAMGVDDNTRFIAISAGNEHSCGIKADRTAVCWGTNYDSRSHPSSHPDIDANTQFIAISAGNEHSCGITTDSTVACWGSAEDNRTNPASANIQQANTTADMVYLAERSEIIPAAVEFQAVIEVTVPRDGLMLDRGESTTLTLFTLASTTTDPITIAAQIQDPNDQAAVDVDPQQATLTNTNPHGSMTVLASDTIAASTYIVPVDIVLKAITGNVRFTPTATITVAVASPDLYKVSLATAAITIAEGDTRTITLNIESTPSQAITVNLLNSNTDQITIDSSATFAPGTSATTATISIVDDNDRERETRYTIRLTTAQGDTRTYIGTPQLTVIIPADNDRAVTIAVRPTTLQLAPEDSASIHIAVPPRFAITGPVAITANTNSDIITVTPMQLTLQPTNTAAAITVTAVPNTGPSAQARATTITLTAASTTEVPQLSADNIMVTVKERGITLKVKVYLEGALP